MISVGFFFLLLWSVVYGDSMSIGPKKVKHTLYSTSPRTMDWLPEEVDTYFGHPSLKSSPYDMVAFRDFLQKAGFASVKTQQRFDEDYGLYAVATDTIHLNELLVSVGPLAYQHRLSPNLLPLTQQRQFQAQAFLEGPGLAPRDYSVYQLYMLITLLSEYKQPQSYWSGYLKVLQNITLPYMLNETHIDALNDNGEGGFTAGAFTEIQDDIALLLTTYPELYDDIFSDNKFVQFGLSSVLSRCFGWGVGDATNEYTLIPGLDLFNHDSDYINHYSYAEVQDIEFRSTRVVRKNEEIVLAYRRGISNSHLLQYYGFAVPRHHDDYILFRIAMGAMSEQERVYTLHYDSSYEIAVEAVVGYNDHIPTGMIRTMDLLLGGNGSPSNRAYKALIQLVELELQSFKTTLEEDENSLRKAQGYCHVDRENKDRSCARDDALKLVYSTRIEIQRLLLDILNNLKQDQTVCQCVKPLPKEDQPMGASVDNNGNVQIQPEQATLGGIVCDECLVSNRRTLKQIGTEKPMRVITLAREYGDVKINTQD